MLILGRVLLGFGVGFGNKAVPLFLSEIVPVQHRGAHSCPIYAVDKIRRRKLLLQACFQIFICQVVIGFILLLKLSETGSISRPLAAVIVVLVCLYVMAFAWLCRSLGWLIPSETLPLETRIEGFAFAVSTNMLCTFIIAQAFLSMLCQMRAAIFFFFAGWIIIMCLFVWKLLPETKNVPIYLMVEQIWKKHPVWRKFMD
ncbi:hypothetical protein JCGZ_02151 [Jatropha curcas]|uniref:Major facilitator superfamily (MFS) profile domain-containing protein n=1 Tax=Jatropha curcas TaxID=180498 RepID=A0A067KYW3_JATCU|nr:hypothetical protein JCGZ_02151 [Jatropha curcas]